MAIVEHQLNPGEGLPPRPAGDTALRIVVFAIGSQRYGLPVELVREVVPLPALLELAGAASGVCGLLNRRGTYIPVIDGHTLVGLPRHASLDSQVLLVGGAEAEIGLLVDQVTAVEHLASSQSTGLDRRSAGAFLESVLSSAAGPILLLHFPALLAMAPALIRPTQR